MTKKERIEAAARMLAMTEGLYWHECVGSQREYWMTLALDALMAAHPEIFGAKSQPTLIRYPSILDGIDGLQGVGLGVVAPDQRGES